VISATGGRRIRVPLPAVVVHPALLLRSVFALLTAAFRALKIASEMRRQTLAEARWILVILALLTFAGWFVTAWLSLFFLFLIGFTLFFFRDPNRASPVDPNAVVAAADGTVTDVSEVEENEVLRTKKRRVSIFLSIFDVHVNRAPIHGRIIYRQHREGLCVDARRPDCTEKNEAITWAFENSHVTLVVRQLTGAIARRIVAWSNVGDEVKKGDRFGMIRFGSRTEVYLPLEAEVVVKVGDRVLGGSTIIARLSG
jgi:phosphatidylserine decarboxylase